jgi:hypothetical protein
MGDEEKRREISDAELLVDLGKNRAELVKKEAQLQELTREIANLKSSLRGNLVRASRFLQAEITSLGPDEEELAAVAAVARGKNTTYGPNAVTKIGKVASGNIYKEVIMEIGNYIRSSPPGSTVPKGEIRNFVSKRLGVKNDDGFGTGLGQHLRYMVKGKAVERVSKGNYKWIGPRADLNDPC